MDWVKTDPSLEQLDMCIFYIYIYIVYYIYIYNITYYICQFRMSHVREPAFGPSSALAHSSKGRVGGVATFRAI